MTHVTALLEAGVAIVRRDAAIHFSYRFRVLSQALTTLFSLTLFFYISRLVHVARFPDPDDYFAFVVVGLVILQALTATLSTLPGAIQQELVAGTFERVAVSPLGPARAIVAMAIFPLAWALLTGLATLALAGLVFGLPLAWPSALAAVPVALLAVLAFLPFAFTVGALVLVSKQAGNVGRLLVVGLSLAGGVYFPSALLPNWIEWVSYAQPFTPALDLLRHLLVGSEPLHAPGLDLLRLAGFAIVAAPLALVALSAAARACRRRGTLIEA